MSELTQANTSLQQLSPSGDYWLGDILVVFPGNAADPISRFSSAVSRGAVQQEYAVLTTTPSSDWRGFPTTEYEFGSWTIWLLGELYGGTTGQDVIDVVTERGSADDLNGHFVIFARNSSTETWHVWTDRFGTIHAYFGECQGRRALGTYCPSVAQHVRSSKLDWLGITSFCSTGLFLEDRTYHQNVRVLRPARHFVFNYDGRLEQEAAYWDWSFSPDYSRSYQETVDEFGERLSTVMADEVRSGQIALPISGGLDSRSTVAAAPLNASSGTRIWAFSYGYSDDSVETHIAEQLASARGLQFKSFRTSGYLFRELEKVADAVEGFQDLTQSRQASVISALAHRSDYVIAAHWGDVWLDTESVDDGSSLHDRIMKKFSKRGRSWLMANVCAPQIAPEQPEDVVRRMIGDELDRIPAQPNDSYRFKAFKTNQWSFRWTLASLRQYQRAAFPRLPFYDTRLTDFFQTVPSEYLVDRRLQVDYLKRFAPDLAAVKWQRYDADLFSYHRYNTWHLPKRAFKKLRQTVFPSPATTRNWELQFLSESGREGLHQWLLGPDLDLHEFVSAREVRSLLDDLYAAPNAAVGYSVSILLTLSAVLQRYARP